LDFQNDIEEIQAKLARLGWNYFYVIILMSDKNDGVVIREWVVSEEN
jgi:hypothetical protein